MGTLCVENSVLGRGGFAGSCGVSSRCVFPAAGRSVVSNVKVTTAATKLEGLDANGLVESRLVPSRKHPRTSFGNSLGQRLNLGRIESRRRNGARSAVVTEQPVTDPGSSPEGLEKWVIAAEKGFNVVATDFVVRILETLYAKRLYARFYVLETIARVPYFAFVSVLHMYESFGWWRRSDYLKIHFAESWNELHHLLVMEALGGDERWIDRFVAQHIAVGYYFMTSFMYLVSPRMAYHFSECVEKHAFETYDKFIKSHGEELKKLPAPAVAVQYYTKGDLYMFDEFQTDVAPHSRRPKIDNLYDVFVNIREDEAQHCKTMQACQSGSSLRSPHEDVPLTELASLDDSVLPPVNCEGLLECAITSSSSADRLRKKGELAAMKSEKRRQ
ncbi:unnamed protein product [Calypogeia fissa]